MVKELEIERTFLLKSIPEGIENAKRIEMEDIYIPETARHPVIRIRRVGDRMEITKKIPPGDDHSEQDEHTIALTKEEFDVLSRIPGKRVVKTRYVMEYNGRTVEIDIFKGPLEGLIVADFEFGSSGERDSFVPPDFCLADVTQEEFLAGGMLCKKGYSDIEHDLKRFGYQRINQQAQ